MSEDKEFDDLLEAIGEAGCGHQLGTVIEVLVFLLADCGRQTEMSQQAFTADVYKNLNEIYSKTENNNGNSTH